MDMASYIEARRRARQGENSVTLSPSASEDAERSSLFRIDRERMTEDYAEYLFFGWSEDVQRDTTQRISVYKGSQPDIRRAVVRSMVGVIRRSSRDKDELLWASRRLRRTVTLSLRPADEGRLEAFLMDEFFGNAGSAPLPRGP
jgi:hypothetical protein